MKRFFAFILATMMIISIVPISPVIALGTATFSVSEAEGSAGEEVTLAINVESNPGVVVIGLQIGYDSSVLELKSAAGKDFADTSFGPTTGNPFHVTWEDVLNPNNTNGGVIAELTFLIKADAPLGESVVTVSYDEENVFNSNFNNVYFATQNGKVTVVEKAISVTGVTIDETLSVNIGEKKMPSYAVIPGNASNRAVSFATGNASIASVNEATGEVMGVSKGSTIITVTTADGGFTDTCTVTVSCPHTNKTNIAKKTPTCTEQGWEAYSQCDVCGQLFNASGVEISEIPYLNVLPHTPADPVKENEIEATCEDAGGYDNVVYCTVCGEELSREHKTILATGHAYGQWNVVTPATCEVDGVEKRICSNDTSHFETRPIPATGHSWGEWEVITEATEENDGLKKRVCSICKGIDEQVIPAIEHVHYYDSVTTTPTCTERGYTTHTCRCGDSYIDSYVSALGHDYASEVTVPTCTEAGYTTYTCTRCKDSYVADEISALGHNLTHFEAKEANKNADGNIEYWKCSVCGDYFSDVEGTNMISAESVVIRYIPILGDVNEDGKLNARDIIALMRYLTGWEDEEFNVLLADYDGNGRVNARDVVAIMLYIIKETS